MNESNQFLMIILSSAVFAALVSSLTNLIISLINNRRLSVIEKQKKRSEIDKYRYIQLHEMLLNWDQYTTIKMPQDIEDGNNESEYMAYIRKSREYILNVFIDDRNRYDMIRPLLSEKYKNELDILKEEGNNLLYSITLCENQDDCFVLEQKYAKLTKKFSDKLKNAINQQLQDLLIIDNV